MSRAIVRSPLWKSIFRHDYDDTPRNRLLMVLGNVWFHLHPAKLPRHGVRIRFTWCMGGISFLLFLVLTFTGVILMFYYRPVGEYAYLDMKYLEFDVPFGMFVRNMHRWAAHAMVIAVWLHMLRVFLTGSYKPPREFNWAIGVLLLVVDPAAKLYRISFAMGPARHVGRNRGDEHGPGHAAAWPRGTVCRGDRD